MRAKHYWKIGVPKKKKTILNLEWDNKEKRAGYFSFMGLVPAIVNQSVTELF